MFALKRPLALLWTLGIVVALLTPGTTLEEVPVGISDLLAHTVLFAGFGFLWTRIAPRRRTAVLLAGLALGGLLEVSQWALPIHRGAEWLDWIADGAGLLLGISGASLFTHKQDMLKQIDNSKS